MVPLTFLFNPYQEGVTPVSADVLLEGAHLQQIGRFRKMMEEKKYSVASLPRPLASSNFRNCTILVLSGYSTNSLGSFSNSEATLILNWLLNGGSLLLMPLNEADLNIVSKHFGITFISPSIEKQNITIFSHHDVVKGINRVYIRYGCAQLNVTSPAEAIAFTDNGKPVIAISRHGKGRIIAISTQDLIDNWFFEGNNELFYDNALLMKNIIDWLTETEHKYAQPELCFSNSTDQFIPNNCLDAVFVVGRDAPTIDMVGMVIVYEAFNNLAKTPDARAIYDTDYASSDLVEGPLVIIGRPDTNLFWQKFNTNSSWAYFSVENGKYFIKTSDGHEYRNSTGVTWAVIQLVWDPEKNRPVLLIGGLDGYATHGACYWFAHYIDHIIIKNVHAFILKYDEVVELEYML